jgi:outer membrane immunogenic protein
MYKFLKCSFVTAALVSMPVVVQAADVRAPAYRAAAPVPYYDWTGFYAGAHVGAATNASANGDTDFIGGGQVGFNYQIGRWVVGVEGELSATSGDVDWITTFAGRFGWLIDQWLIYGKVGAAWAHVDVGNFNHTSSGLLLGVGTEYALRDNWTVKFEYNMMDFDHDFFNDDKVHVFKVGLNYRFGYGPLAPAPGPRITK